MANEAIIRNSKIISMRRENELDLKQLEPGDSIEVTCEIGTVWIAILKHAPSSELSDSQHTVYNVMAYASEPFWRLIADGYERSSFQMHCERYLRVGEEFLLGPIKTIALNRSELFLC